MVAARRRGVNTAVIVAAGKSERMGPDVDKAFLSLGGRPVLAHSLLAFEQCPCVDQVVLVVRRDRVNAARGMAQVYGCSKVRAVVPGGALRQLSVMNGLSALEDETKIVIVHDGARPCVTPMLIEATVDSARKHASGVAAVKVTDTVKAVERGMVVHHTVDRSKLWTVQTPQTFRRDLLCRAYDFVVKKRQTVTDEAAAVELLGEPVHLVMSSWGNIKITSREDLALAALLLHL